MGGVIIGVVGKKGGCGKTTVSVNLAGVLRELLNQDVLLIDADPQGTALTWRTAAGDDSFPVQVIGFPKPVLHHEAAQLAKGYGAAVIDSPSGYVDERIQRSVMLASDLVLLPVQPSAVDIWSARDTVALFEQAQEIKPGLQAAVLISRFQSQTRLSKEAREALEGLKLPVFQSTISQRVALAECPLHGKLITHHPQNPAADEFRSLAREILEALHYDREKVA